MASSLDDALAAAQAENELPASTPEPIATEGTPPSPEAPAPTGNEPQGTPETQDEADFKTYAQEYLKEHPELAPVAEKIEAGMRKAYLEKTQQLAEQRKQLDGLDPQTAQFVRELDAELRTNPQAAMQRIAAVQQQLQRQYGPPADPLQGMQFATETEKLLAQQVAELQQHHQQQQIRTYEATIQAEFDGLGKEFGREIPVAERQQVLAYAMQNRFPSVSAAFKMMNYDSIMKSREEKARNEASAIVTSKANASPAPSPLSQKPPATPDAPRNLDAILQRAIADAGL